MSTDRSPIVRRAAAAAAVYVAGIALIIVVGLLLQEHGPGNMGRGVLQGAAVGTVGALFMLWRATRRPPHATTFERAWTQTGDERDDAVLTRALAVLGLATLPITSAGAIAIAFGAPVEMVLVLLLTTQVVVGAVAFVVIARRS
ncbi:conserved hypothetical protein [Cellulomonas flavigena DSM 20109]|uniref:Uncharacterized protein n=1 Tax=Cellulomonas flavigena (strain ATCC 482 / DSM 20109 / BCRC 11376 / JCM 18109 / NBRC 3775 / NCIMB 8073 / NRS 134) TaxID=446466 RepID=D5UHQ2_CELFN|nr:hypothetical protein [Cellulomonas flavigena]ADG73326.1 conserved hypothetical protein [Cellulomonas flavigena DSM 20109]